MNGAIGMTGLILQTNLDPRQMEYATIAKNSAESLLGIINDILDVLFETAGKKGVLLATRYPQELPTRFLGDPGRVRQILKGHGLEVDLAEDGKLCLEAMEETVYDVIFMDCQMPVMDGLEAAAQVCLRKGENWSAPVIALTARRTKKCDYRKGRGREIASLFLRWVSSQLAR